MTFCPAMTGFEDKAISTFGKSTEITEGTEDRKLRAKIPEFLSRA